MGWSEKVAVQDPSTLGVSKVNTLGASKSMHVVHSVGFAMGVGDGWFHLTGEVENSKFQRQADGQLT